MKQTYRDNSKLNLVNAAINDKNGVMPFYKLSFTNEVWATGLASFEKSNIQKHIDQGYVDRKSIKSGISLPSSKDEYIEEIEISTITFEKLLEDFQIENVNLLCIDVEGFDYNILKLFDFKKYSPEIVLYESKHLSDLDFTESK